MFERFAQTDHCSNWGVFFPPSLPYLLIVVFFRTLRNTKQQPLWAALSCSSGLAWPFIATPIKLWFWSISSEPFFFPPSLKFSVRPRSAAPTWHVGNRRTETVRSSPVHIHPGWNAPNARAETAPSSSRECPRFSLPSCHLPWTGSLQQPSCIG